MSETILRQLLMLQRIPHHPGKIDSTLMQNALASEGYEVSKRTVQRDLDKLSRFFPIVSDETPGHYGWSWMKGADPVLLASMSPHVAISLKIAEQFFLNMLPTGTAEHLKGYFKAAEGTLEAVSSGLHDWQEKVHVTPRSQAFLPPEVAEGVSSAVYGALYRNRQLNLRYHTADDRTEKAATIHPLGLIIREPVIYLACTFWDFQDVRQIPLHRINQATELEADAVSPQGFKLASFVSSRESDIIMGDPMTLEAKLNKRQAGYLAESPLGEGQQLTQESENSYHLKVRLKDTIQLRRWILSLTGELEVLKPQYLRAEIRGAIARQMEAYANE